MNDSEYFEEISQQLDTGAPASLEFCKEFIRRLDAVDHSHCPEEFLGRDSEDYWAWGEALGMGEDDGESFVYDHDCFGEDDEIRSPEFIKEMEEFNNSYY